MRVNLIAPFRVFFSVDAVVVSVPEDVSIAPLCLRQMRLIRRCLLSLGISKTDRNKE